MLAALQLYLQLNVTKHLCGTLHQLVVWSLRLGMQAVVQAGQQLLERWTTRNQAVAQLDAVVDEVSGPVSSQSLPSQSQQGMLPNRRSSPVQYLEYLTLQRLSLL